MAIAEVGEEALAEKFAGMRLVLNERQWRHYLGFEARALGEGGIALVARLSRASETTVRAGMRDIADPAALPPGRSRRAGAGRPRAEDAQPGLEQALGGLLEEGKRGDPVAEITWSILSLRDISRQMARLGFTCGKDAVARLMRADGWSLQGMAKVLEGRQHPGRDRQFGHIAAMTGWFRGHGYPVISVDTKKKEMLGAYHRDGRSWRPQGDPVKVRDHDFAGKDTVTIAPYGIYDVTANRGFAVVGTSRDTAAFAVNAIRLWWQQEGSLRYPGASRLLVTCDAGGSNGHRCRLWKEELARLAAETGLKITVCHFPPGTSKWNKIEHALFCHITRTWSARPLMTIDDAVAGIAATITAQGLKCTAVRDGAVYPGGVKIGDARMKYLEEHVIVRHGPHRDWNCTILPAPRSAPGPGPEPEPEPERPGRVPAAVLNHPALTGITTEDLNALAAALDIPFEARLQQQYHIRRGGRRTTAVRSDAPHASRRLDVTDHLLALRLRDHLDLPVTAIGALLGIDRSTVSHATALASELLAAARITPPATPPPQTIPRTPGELLAYAAAAGISLTLPENTQAMPEHFRTRRTRTTRDTPAPATK